VREALCGMPIGQGFRWSCWWERGSALRHADRAGIPLVLLVGARERDAGEAVLRVMKARRECRVPLEQLAERIAGELKTEGTDGQG
jgi:hypothetical protein